MVLANPTPELAERRLPLRPDGAHLEHLDYPAVDAYANTAGATATINQSTITTTDPAPFTASFSSRGPLTAGGGDLLKPDVIAPGQDILAAMAPTAANAGRDFDLASGTSMSSPHVAGLAALLMDKHPSWSPMAIKSALMTTGTTCSMRPISDATRDLPAGCRSREAEQRGQPWPRVRPGINDWLGFICGTSRRASTRSARRCTRLHGRERLQRRVDRDRRHGRRPDGQADGQERRRLAADVRGQLHRARWLHRWPAGELHDRPRRNTAVELHVHADNCNAERVHGWADHAHQRRTRCPDPGRHQAGRAWRLRSR